MSFIDDRPLVPPKHEARFSQYAQTHRASSTSLARIFQYTKVKNGGVTTTILSPGRNAASNSPPTGRYVEPDAAGFWTRRWRHVRRWWYWYALGAVVLIVVGLVILFLVIVPAIMQRIVNITDLPVHSASLLAPTANGVQFSLNASLKVPAGITVDLKPLTLGLFNANTSSAKNPYLKLSLPETKLKGNTTISVADQAAQILDLEQFTDFIGTYVKSDEFVLSEAGETTAFLGALKATIKLNKNIKMKGLNNLAGFNFPELAFLLTPEADGSNLNGTVMLPNPSVITSALGNLTLDMKTANITLGKARINNVVLAPGNNTFPLTATLDIKTAIRNLRKILAAQKDALKSGNVEISASGNSTVYNGVHIPYYENVLKNVVLTAKIPLIQILMDSTESLAGSNAGLIQGLLGALNKTNEV